MKRLLTVALAASLLVAAAPADSEPPEGYSHEVVFDTGDAVEDAATVQGDLPGGANLTPFLGIAGVDQNCGSDVDNYCELTFLKITNEVEDTGPNVFDVEELTIDIDVTADVPGSDFDLFVYETDETGADRFIEKASSGNAPGCAQLCATPAGAAYTNRCDATDECVTLTVTTTEVNPNAYLRVEVVYFTSPAGYSMNLSLR